MKLINVIVTLAVTTVFMSGCATFVSQASNWPVAIQSNPSGAAFTITKQNGIEIITGTTPANVRLASGAGYFNSEKYTVKYIKEGFEEKTATFYTSINDVYFWGNLFFGEVLTGMLLIDPLTGAMYKLPETVNTDLTAEVNTKPL